MKRFRPLAPTALLLFLLLPQAARAKDQPPPPEPAKALRVAVMPLMNVSSEVLADQIVSQAMKEQLAEFDAARATFLFPSDVQRVLSAHEEFARALRISEQWGKKNTLDSTAVEGLDTLLTANALLCVRISEWDVKRIMVINAGQSYTTIGLQFALFDIRTKKLLWKKDAREQRYAPEYDVSSGTVSYDEIGQIQTRTANEPPRPKEVVGEVIRSAFKKFPYS